MNPNKLWLIPLMVTAGCYADRSVGVSMGRDTESDVPVKAKFPSKVVGQLGEALGLESPLAGDVDGDGLDDFLVLAIRTPAADGSYQRPLLYLFYGKPEFPAELSTAAAEAAFEVDGGAFNGAVRDINGDGYSDLMLTLSDSVNFIFGGAQRLSGIVERGTGGVKWTFDALPPPFSNELLVQHSVRGVGDLNGDGCADLLLRASAVLSAETGEYVDRAWIVPGHRGEWTPTAWDGNPLLANVGQVVQPASFDPHQTVALLEAESAGDVDGDARSDLLAFGTDRSLMFYGKREYPTEISEAAADATLRIAAAAIHDDLGPSALFAQRLGDLDGDGKDDLFVAGSSDPFRIVYGQRWSGESVVQTELEISTTAPEKRILGAAAGDIDGDGFPELVLQVVDVVSEEITSSFSSVYVVRGTGERMRGTIQLSESDRWEVPSAQSTASLGVDRLVLGGDIDGDGSQEILTSFAPSDLFDLNGGSVYLVPSTPRAPD